MHLPQAKLVSSSFRDIEKGVMRRRERWEAEERGVEGEGERVGKGGERRQAGCEVSPRGERDRERETEVEQEAAILWLMCAETSGSVLPGPGKGKLPE